MVIFLEAVVMKGKISYTIVTIEETECAFMQFVILKEKISCIAVILEL